MKNSLLSILLLLVATNASAQSPDPCATQRNTIEINDCGKLILAKKDKELNMAYKKLIDSLASDDKGDDTNYAEVKKHLLEAQRNWIKFRDSDCRGMLTLHESGSIRGSVYLSCLSERTEQRTKELLNWAKI